MDFADPRLIVRLVTRTSIEVNVIKPKAYKTCIDRMQYPGWMLERQSSDRAAIIK